MKIKIKTVTLCFLLAVFSSCTDWEQEAQNTMNEGDKMLASGSNYVSKMVKANKLRGLYSSLIMAQIDVNINETEENINVFMKHIDSVERVAKVNLQEDKEYFANIFKTNNYKYDAAEVVHFISNYKNEMTRFSAEANELKENAKTDLKTAIKLYTNTIEFIEKTDNKKLIKLRSENIIACYQNIMHCYHMEDNRKEFENCLKQLSIHFDIIGEKEKAQKTRQKVKN